MSSIPKLIIIITGLMLCFGLKGAEVIYWKGQRIINNPVIIKRSQILKIAPGTKVHFEGQGYLKCYGHVYAEGVTFKSSHRLNGVPRISFFADSEIRNCLFSGITSNNVKYHDAAIRFIGKREGRRIVGGSNIFIGNSISKCSPVEFVMQSGSSICFNTIVDGVSGGKGIVLFHSEDTLVQSNYFCNVNKPAILLDESNNNLIEANRIFNSNGVSIYNSSRNNFVIANAMFNCSSGITLRKKVSRNLILSNLIEMCNNGLRIWGCGSENIVGNCVFVNYNQGINVVNISPEIKLIIRNSIFANGKIVVRTAYSGLKLENNFFHNNQTKILVSGNATVEQCNNIEASPKFDAASFFNCRLQPVSPLLGNGSFPKTNIGLFPEL